MPPHSGALRKAGPAGLGPAVRALLEAGASPLPSTAECPPGLPYTQGLGRRRQHPGAKRRLRASADSQPPSRQTPGLTRDAAQTGAQEKVWRQPHVSLIFLGLWCKEVAP